MKLIDWTVWGQNCSWQHGKFTLYSRTMLVLTIEHNGLWNLPWRLYFFKSFDNFYRYPETNYLKIPLDELALTWVSQIVMIFIVTLKPTFVTQWFHMVSWGGRPHFSLLSVLVLFGLWSDTVWFICALKCVSVLFLLNLASINGLTLLPFYHLDCNICPPICPTRGFQGHWNWGIHLICFIYHWA